MKRRLDSLTKPKPLNRSPPISILKQGQFSTNSLVEINDEESLDSNNFI
jgi:hypothetical protein